MTEGNCVSYESITKYVCLKCDAFARNRSLKCSVSASENYPGWKECTKVTLCFKCDKEEHAADYQQQDSSEEKDNEEVVETLHEVKLVVYCALRRFHEYQKTSPKFRQKLNIKRDKINFSDPYAMGLYYCEIRGRIESLTLVGHLPRKISPFCKHFWKYNGKLDATVRSIKSRRSPLPQ